MKSTPIISQTEALQILRNDLRRAAVAKRAADLEDASSETRATILAEIEHQVEQEIQKREKISPLRKHFHGL